MSRELAEHLHAYAQRLCAMTPEERAAETARHDALGWAEARARAAHVQLSNFGAPLHQEATTVDDGADEMLAQAAKPGRSVRAKPRPIEQLPLGGVS